MSTKSNLNSPGRSLDLSRRSSLRRKHSILPNDTNRGIVDISDNVWEYLPERDHSMKRKRLSILNDENTFVQDIESPFLGWRRYIVKRNIDVETNIEDVARHASENGVVQSHGKSRLVIGINNRFLDINDTDHTTHNASPDERSGIFSQNQVCGSSVDDISKNQNYLSLPVGDKDIEVHVQKDRRQSPRKNRFVGVNDANASTFTGSMLWKGQNNSRYQQSMRKSAEESVSPKSPSRKQDFRVDLSNTKTHAKTSRLSKGRRSLITTFSKEAVFENSITQTSVSPVLTSLKSRPQSKKLIVLMNKIQMKQNRGVKTRDSSTKGSERRLESPESYTSPRNLRSSGDCVLSVKVKNESPFVKSPRKSLTKRQKIGDQEELSDGTFDLDLPESDIFPIAESTNINHRLARNQQSNKQLTTHKETVKLKTKSNNLDGTRGEIVCDERSSSTAISFLNFPGNRSSIKKGRSKRKSIKKPQVTPSMSKALDVDSIRNLRQTSNYKSVSDMSISDVTDFTDSDKSRSSEIYKQCPELKSHLDEIMSRRAAAAEERLKPAKQTTLHHFFACGNPVPQSGAKLNQLGKSTSKPKRVPKPPDPNRVCDGRVYKNPRLAKPASWINQRFYNKITKAFSKNLEEYDIVSNAEVEKYVLKLHQLVKAVLKIPYNKKRTQNEDNKILAVMQHLYKKGLIKTKLDFLKFCKDYLPEVFLAKGMIYPFPNGPHIPSGEKVSAIYLLKDLNL